MSRLFRAASAISLAALTLASPARLSAQFLDHFDGDKIEGWLTMVGDGTPRFEFVPNRGSALMKIDGSTDPYNVWWTLIKRNVAPEIDVARLQRPGTELRVEARIRSSHAPRRINFMINTQRTTDFHEHLREYDLPDTGWHRISMTTKNLDARPGDSVFVQMAATDFGRGQYTIEIDYYRADVVDAAENGADVGEPLIYHPTVPNLNSFSHHETVAADSVIHEDFPSVNFNNWTSADGKSSARVLTVHAKQSAILRWDFAAVKNRKVSGPGVLELTTHSVLRGGKYVPAFGEDLGIEFGKVRVIEILGGDTTWNEETVTYATLLGGATESAVFNSQMTFDTDVAPNPGERTQIVLSRPVMQRLIDGTTKGLVLQPLGAIAATFHAREDDQDRGPKLHFSLQ